MSHRPVRKEGWAVERWGACLAAMHQQLLQMAAAVLQILRLARLPRTGSRVDGPDLAGQVHPHPATKSVVLISPALCLYTLPDWAISLPSLLLIFGHPPNTGGTGTTVVLA